MRLKPHQEFILSLRIVLLCVTKGWSWAHVKRVSSGVLNSDINTVRIILANASAIWALSVFLDPSSFDRPAFATLKVLAGSTVWAVLFMLHFLGVYWRTYDPISRPTPALFINSLGFLLWFYTTVSLNFYIGSLSPSTALEITMCGASAWALYKTGFGQNERTPL